MNASLNTPKSERTDAFYEDQFTSSSNWGPGEFEKFVQEIGFVEPDSDDFICQRALRVWEAMTRQQREEFASAFDDWLDA
jgi:hypothetical protein